MARTILKRNSFNAGEISALALGRTDLGQYANACEALENFIPLIVGGITRRPGTRFIANAMGPSRLVEFIFSLTQSFILEFGNQAIRFYTNGGQIQLAGNPYQISSPFDTAVDDLWDLKFAQQGDIVYIVHPNHPPMKLARVSNTNWVLGTPAFRPSPMHAFDQDIGSPNADHAGAITLTPAATSGMGVALTASAAVFIDGDVGKMIIAGNGVAFITAVGGTTAIDPNTGATLNTQATCDILNAFASTAAIAAGAWFLRGQPSSYACFGTGSPAAFTYTSKFGAGLSLNLFAFSVFPVGGGAASAAQDTWREIDVGRYVVIDGAVGSITGLTNANKVTVRLYSPVTVTQAGGGGAIVAAPAAPDAWSVQDPAFSAANGYPRAVCFFQGRLVFAGSLALPQTIWWSSTDDYENFAIGSQDSNAIIRTLASGGLETILAVEDYNGNLAALTARTEYMVGAGSVQFGSVAQALTPSNVTIIRQSRWGATRVQPLEVQGDMVYVKRSGLIAGAMIFDIQSSKYKTQNLNILSQLITTSGFKEMVYQQFPNPVIWFTTLDGNRVGLTYEREQQVWGWHRHFTGQDLWGAALPVENGKVRIPDTPPPLPDTYISQACIPDPSGLTDQMWMCCKRTLNGAPTYTIELEDPALYVDCASQAVFNPKVSQVGNLAYLAGRTVVANVDGAVEPEFLMDGAGVYHLEQSFKGADIQVGMNFISKCITTRVEMPAPGGDTIQGVQKRWSRIWGRVYQTIGAIIDGYRIPFRRPSDPMGEGVPPFTGDVALDGNPGYDRDGRITIIQDQPLPLTVLAQFGTLSVGTD